MEGLPGWVISPMPGPPPRQHKHERTWRASPDEWSHTKHTLSHPNKANMEWWLRRPNDIRGPWGLELPDICLTGEEKPRKNLTQETCPDRGSNPGPLRDRRACYHLAYRDGLKIRYKAVKALGHGCARVAHCVTARWRNFSHYCCPLRQYDVWFTCSEHREALTDAPIAHDVHKQEFTVQGGST